MKSGPHLWTRPGGRAKRVLRRTLAQPEASQEPSFQALSRWDRERFVRITKSKTFDHRTRRTTALRDSDDEIGERVSTTKPKTIKPHRSMSQMTSCFTEADRYKNTLSLLDEAKDQDRFTWFYLVLLGRTGPVGVQNVIHSRASKGPMD